MSVHDVVSQIWQLRASESSSPVECFLVAGTMFKVLLRNASGTLRDTFELEGTENGRCVVTYDRIALIVKAEWGWEGAITIAHQGRIGSQSFGTPR